MNAVVHVGARFAPYAFLGAQNEPYNPGARGVIQRGGTSVTFIGCDFSSCQIAADLGSCNNTIFQGCYFEDIAVGVLLGNHSQNLVTYNTTIDNCYFSMTNKVAGVICVDISRTQYLILRNNVVRTNQPATTATIKYKSAIGDNKSVLIDSNRYYDASQGGEANFVSAIQYDIASPINRIKKYSTVDV